MQIDIKKIHKKDCNLDPLLLKEHRNVVLGAEDLYPGIEGWYDLKAKPGIEKGERIGYLVKRDGIPIGAAVARHGSNAKICTVRVREEAMHQDIGKILFLLLAMNLRRGTKQVHFTAPENLWNLYEHFFNEMGFISKGYSHEQYRFWDNEIAAEADYIQFRDLVFNKYLPRYAGLLAQIDNDKVDLILSLKPEYANRIINKTKVMELRRKFSKKWIGSCALIYSSSPERAFVAKVKIKDVIKDHPASIWLAWHQAIDCTEDDYHSYTQDADEIYGIIFDEITSIGPIPKSRLEYLLHHSLTPPQSYCSIVNNPNWESAVGITNLLRQII